MQIDIRKASKAYKTKNGVVCPALKNISIQIEKGELIAIIGKSGSGKSTLLHALGLCDKFDSGEYYLNGIDVSTLTEKRTAQIRNRDVGYIMQDFALVNQMSIYDNVAIPLYIRNEKRDQIQVKVKSALKKVQLEGLSKKRINELSGGQKQRAAIARALASEPGIILADEPTGALDVNTGNEIMKLLAGLNGLGTTIIIVTHDMEIATMCKRIINLADGRIAL